MIPTVTAGKVLVGTLSFSGSTPRGVLPNYESHQRLLGVQPVLRLIPHGRLRSVEDLLCDLLAVMGGEAVQDDRVVAGIFDQFRVDAEIGEVVQPPLSLVLLSH